MEKNIKLLYPFSGIAGIFFPVGKLEDDGTCEFASKKCLLACAAIHCMPENKYEIIGHEKKKELYDFITKKPIFEICAKIMQELEEMKYKLLYWFASGDCERKHVKKIIRIIKYLNIEGIIQCGFTRNKKFWNKIKEDANIALTLETYTEVQKTQTEGLFAIPDYKMKTVIIYRGITRIWSCGSTISYNKLKTDSRQSNCFECYNKKEGCFTEIN